MDTGKKVWNYVVYVTGLMLAGMYRHIEHAGHTEMMQSIYETEVHF